MARRVFAACAILVSLAFLPAAAPKRDVVPRTELSHRCSRSVSRSVRKQLEKEILRPSQKAGIQSLPAGCPFDPTRDMYAYHEKQKQRKKPGRAANSWTCGICGKVFKNEHYLDLHLERRHMNESTGDGVCLADYCEMFEVCQGESRYRARREPACQNESLASARRRCEEGLQKCFPLGEEVSRSLHAKWSRTWCQVLDCKIRDEKRKEHEAALIPVIVVLILILLVCFVIFSMVVCCVDYSDDIFQFMQESGIASSDFIKRCRRARETTRTTIGFDRTAAI